MGIFAEYALFCADQLHLLLSYHIIFRIIINYLDGKMDSEKMGIYIDYDDNYFHVTWMSIQ